MSKKIEAWRSANLFKIGIGYVIVSRHKAGGEFEAGVFLLDVYCLGVKDAFFREFPAGQLDSLHEKMFGVVGKVALTPACARKLIEDAVAYANRLGLPPHEDHKQACRVLGGIVAAECGEAFTFGEPKSGKPLYVQGPNDTPAFVQRVMNTLQRDRGTGNFDFVIETPSPD